MSPLRQWELMASSGAAVPLASSQSGLDWPGSDGVNFNTIRFQFSTFVDPRSTGSAVTIFPHQPATYIWKCYPRVQPAFSTGNYGYYGNVWWARCDGTLDDTTGWYYNAGPYPGWHSPNVYDGVTKWEIAWNQNDEFLDGPTSPSPGIVVYNQWYTQVLIINGLTYTYYFDYARDNTKTVVATDSTRVQPTNPGIFVGDAPWHEGHELYCGVYRGFQFYDAALSLAQVDSELTTPGSIRTPWYLNLNPTPTSDDSGIADRSGNGHHPTWVGSRRPGLWTG